MHRSIRLPAGRSARTSLPLRPLRLVARSLVAACVCSAVVIHGLGCSSSSDDDHTTPSATANVPSDVIYNAGTDEALASVLGVAAKPDDAKAGKLTAPMDKEAVPASPAFTFAWSAGTAMAPARGPRARTMWAELRRVVETERAAHAHGTPYTGVIYYLVFSTPTVPRLAAVLTAGPGYQPDATTWSKMAASKEPITITMIAARLENNGLTPDGGPFASTYTPSFTVKP